MRSATRRGLSALAVLSLVAGSLLAATPAMAAPDPVSPANGEVFETTSVPFSWTARPAYAGQYRVSWVGLGGSGSTTVSGTDTVVDGFADGTYTWSVSYLRNTFIGPVWVPTLPLRTFAVDTGAPQVTLVTPTASTVVGPGGTVLLTGIIVDPTFTGATLTLDEGDDGEYPIDLGSLNNKIILKSVTAPLTEGLHSLTVTALDSYGRSSTATTWFRVDATGPVATFVKPTSGGYVDPTAGGPLKVDFNESTDYYEFVSVVEGYQFSGSGSSISTTFPWFDWSDGTPHQLRVDAWDEFDNFSQTPVTVIADRLAPTVAWKNPSALGGKSFTVKATASDSASGVASVVMELAHYGVSGCEVDRHVQTPATLVGGAWTATIDTTSLTAGDYCLYATATDGVGHSTELGRSVVLDHTVPGQVTLHAPLDGSTLTSKNVTLGWNAPTGPAETLTYEYELGKSKTLLGNGSLSGSSAATGIDALTSLVKNLKNGTYYWHARALDEAGNPGLWSDVWELKVAVPAPPVPPKVTTTTTDPEPTPTPEVTEPTDEPTDEPTEEPEETDEPTAPSDEPEASGDSGDLGFPAWAAIVIIVLVLGGLAFLLRFFFFRRA